MGVNTQTVYSCDVCRSTYTREDEATLCGEFCHIALKSADEVSKLTIQLMHKMSKEFSIILKGLKNINSCKNNPFKVQISPAGIVIQVTPFFTYPLKERIFWEQIFKILRPGRLQGDDSTFVVSYSFAQAFIEYFTSQVDVDLTNEQEKTDSPETESTSEFFGETHTHTELETEEESESSDNT